MIFSSSSSSVTFVSNSDSSISRKRKSDSGDEKTSSMDKRVRSMSSSVSSNVSDSGWFGRSMLSLGQKISSISTFNAPSPRTSSSLVLSDKVMVQVSGVIQSIASNFTYAAHFLDALALEYLLCESSLKVIQQLSSLEQTFPDLSKDERRQLKKRIQDIVITRAFQNNPTIAQVQLLTARQHDRCTVDAIGFISNCLTPPEQGMIQE